MRYKILEILLQNAQQYVSGEALCKQFGVTRAAIWKHIKALQNEGYEITASTKKGYCLMGLPDRLDAGLVKRGMQTKQIGQEILYEEVVDSTNREAKKAADENAPHGTLVLCDRQLAGRGRLGRSWFSPEKTGLCFSLILRPPITPTSSLPITMLAALAVRNAISVSTGMEAMIKWPNDLQVNGKKVCGILTEMSVTDESNIKWIVLGIGINVNTKEEEFPEEVRKIATSLSIERGLECSRLELVREICRQFEILYDEFIEHGADPAVFLPQYRVYSSTLLRRVRLYLSGEEISGIAEDFDATGALLVREDNGTLRRIFTGEITSHKGNKS